MVHRDEVDTIAKGARSEQPKQPRPESYRRSTNDGCLERDCSSPLTFAKQAYAPAPDREPSASSSAAEAHAWADQARATALAIRDQWEQAARATQAARIIEDEDREERARLARGREALIDELARYSSSDLRRLPPKLIDELLAFLEDDE